MRVVSCSATTRGYIHLRWGRVPMHSLVVTARGRNTQARLHTGTRSWLQFPCNRARRAHKTYVSLWNNSCHGERIPATPARHLISMGPTATKRGNKRECETFWPRPRGKGAAPLFGAFHDDSLSWDDHFVSRLGNLRWKRRHGASISPTICAGFLSISMSRDIHPRGDSDSLVYICLKNTRNNFSWFLCKSLFEI